MAREQFTKIKYDDNKGRVTVKYQIPNGTDEPDLYTVDVREEPHDDFKRALDVLDQDVVAICEQPANALVDVRSVTLTWKDEIMGAVITGLRTLNSARSPLVLNTPHKTVEPYNPEEEDDVGLLPESTVERLEDLIHEAKAFLAGKRAPKAQTEAFGSGIESVTISSGGQSATIRRGDLASV